MCLFIRQVKLCQIYKGVIDTATEITLTKNIYNMETLNATLVFKREQCTKL